MYEKPVSGPQRQARCVLYLNNTSLRTTCVRAAQCPKPLRTPELWLRAGRSPEIWAR
jgi:hypothetical protein